MIRHDRSLRRAGWLATVGLALVALFAPATVSAWVHPTVTPLCAPDAAHYAFTVTLANESDYGFDWSFGNSGPWTTVSGQQGANDLLVARGDGDLFVRWSSDHSSYGSATPNGDLCEQPSSSPSDPVESESIPPSDSPSPSASPSDSPSPSASSSPSASASASSSPSGSVLSETGTPRITPPPTDALASNGTAPGDGWRLLLLVGASLMASIIVLTPAGRRTRR